MKNPASPPPPDPTVSSAADGEKSEALRLQSIAESRLHSSNFKSALKYARRAANLDPSLPSLPSLITAAKILRNSSSSSCNSIDHSNNNSNLFNYYSSLLLPPLSPLSDLKRQFQTLKTLLEHEEIPAAGEALRRAADALDFLSDKSRKRRYDADLRRDLANSNRQHQGQKRSPDSGDFGVTSTFWTACTACRLLHEFDRRYAGRQLVCPNCGCAFRAAEVKSNSNAGLCSPKETTSLPTMSPARSTLMRQKKLQTSPAKTPLSGLTKSPKEKTLAELQMELVRCSKTLPKRSTPPIQMNPQTLLTRLPPPGWEKPPKEKTLAELRKELVACAKLKNKKKNEGVVKGNGNNDCCTLSLKEDEENGDLSMMAVEDSDFYDFDKDRNEKSFKKGQVWAIYDDDDGMPRHYGLIEEVLRVNPFRMKMIWLDFQNNGNDETAMHVSSGRFKLGTQVNILDSVNMFSHLVDCERAAKEIYRVYPKKGSVWALYVNRDSDLDEGRHYDIVVVLTSYSELHDGMSVGCLDKVQGFKTIFKRKEIGFHAVRWIETDELKLLSHQIPSRKLTGMEGVNLPKECWELDPASLPPDLLCISYER